MPNIGVSKVRKDNRVKRLWQRIGLVVLLLTAAILFGLSRIPDPNLILEQEKAALKSTEIQSSADYPGEDAVKQQGLTIVHNRVDITQALEAYAQLYAEQTGLPVDVIEISGGSDYLLELEAMFAAGEMPSIFLLDDADSFSAWRSHLSDLSNEKWVHDTDLAYRDVSGQVLGFPLAAEGLGLVYNLDLLAQAGIDPAQLKNFTALQTACATLNKQKQKLGIDSVFALSVAHEQGMDWLTSSASFNTYLSGGLSYGNRIVLDEVLAGKSEPARLGQYARFVELMFKNSNPQLLTQGSYVDQVTAFADGRAVMTQDSQWLDAMLVAQGADFSRGFMPMPAYLPDTNGLFVDCKRWFVVTSDGPFESEARQFLNALVETPEGQAFLSGDGSQVPAFRTFPKSPNLPLAKSLWRFIEAGNIYSDWRDQLPDDLISSQLSPIFEKYARGELSTVQFTAALEAAIGNLNPDAPPNPAPFNNATKPTTPKPPEPMATETSGPIA